MDAAAGRKLFIPKAPSCPPVRLFLSCLLIGTVFSVWITASDPWWRVKEWVALFLGCGWIALRGISSLRPIRSSTDRWLGILAAGLVCGFSLKFILPAVAAKGNWLTSPWPWMAFLHAMVSLVWMVDLRKLIRRSDAEFIARLMARIGVVYSALLFLQWANLDPITGFLTLKFGKITWLHEDHMIGLMGNSFKAAACLAVLVPAMAYQKGRQWILLTIFSLIVLYLSQSRIGLMAALVGSLFSAGLIRTRARLMAVIAASALALGWALFHLDSVRLVIWTKTLPLIQRYFWVGSGLGQYKELGVFNLISGNSYVVRWAHNEWLHFAAEIGIPLTLFLAAYLLRETIKLSRVHWATCGCMISILILSLFSIPWHLAPTLAVTGICLISSHLEPNPKELKP